MKRIPKFYDFYRVFEAESQELSAANLIISNFFQLYSNIVPLIGGYQDAVKDIKEIQMEDLDKKAEKFVSIINKICGLVKSDSLKKLLAGEDLKKILTDLTSTYSTLVSKSDEEEKKSINKAIISICVDQVEALAKAVKGISESYLENDNNFLFEKNLFKDERDMLTMKITAAEGNLGGLIANPPSERAKTRLTPIFDELTKLKNEVSGEKSDEDFANMKRRERKQRIEEISKKTDELDAEKNKVIAEEAEKIGLDKSLKDQLTKLSELIANFLKELNGEFTKQVTSGTSSEKEGSGEEEEGKDSGKEEKFSELVSGNKNPENLKKAGKNFKDIKNLQINVNKILEISGKPKIKEDGLFGKGTEGAIKQISSALSLFDGSLKSDGVKVSPELQSAIAKIAKDPGKLKQIFDANK